LARESLPTPPRFDVGGTIQTPPTSTTADTPAPPTIPRRRASPATSSASCWPWP